MMKKISSKIGSVVITIVIIVVGLFVHDLLIGFDRFDAGFPTGKAALESELHKKGWIPSWLPENSTDLNLQYDIDSNYRWMSFKLSGNSRFQLMAKFHSVKGEEVENIPTPMPHRVDWWFEGLIQKQPANDAALNTTIFRGNGEDVSGDAYFALGSDGKTIYIWICDVQ